MPSSVSENSSNLPFAAVRRKNCVSNAASARPFSNDCALSRNTPQTSTERAFACAAFAEESFFNGELEKSASYHLQAAKAFIESAETVNDGETAKALLFLSQAHARQSKEMQNYVPTLKLDEKKSKGEAQHLLPDVLEDARISMDDSIMSSKILPRPKEKDHAVIQSCSQDLLELERCLNVIGMGSTSRARLGGTVQPSGRYLSSTLGESFCLLNRSIAPNMISGSMLMNTEKAPSKLANIPKVQSKIVIAPPPPFEKNGSCLMMEEGGSMIKGNDGGISMMNPPVVLSPMNTKSFVVDGNCHAGGQNQAEIMRLLNCMKILGEENAKLMRECEEGRKGFQAAAAASEDISKFKQQYAKRFKHLRKALAEFQMRYPSGNANGMNTPKECNQKALLELENKVSVLSAQNELLKESIKEKDSMLHKYKKWHENFKANVRLKQKAQEGEKSLASNAQQVRQKASHHKSIARSDLSR